MLERSDEIKIREVKAEKRGSGCGEDTVDEQFGSGKVGCRGIHVTLVINEVAAANSKSHSIWISFLRTIVGADAKVCSFLAGW